MQVPVLEHPPRRDRGKGAVHAGARNGAGGGGVKPCLLCGGDLLPQRLSAAQDFVLKRAGDVHHGGVYHAQRVAVFRRFLPHTVQNILLPRGVEHGDSGPALDPGDLLCRIHAPLQQRQQLAVNVVDLIPDRL